MGLEEDFLKSAEDVKNAKSATDEEKLELYKYYKQSTVGDVNIDKPSFLNFVSRSKWNAWNEVKGTSKEDAMKKYIEVVSKIMNCE